MTAYRIKHVSGRWRKKDGGLTRNAEHAQMFWNRSAITTITKYRTNDWTIEVLAVHVTGETISGPNWHLGDR